MPFEGLFEMLQGNAYFHITFSKPSPSFKEHENEFNRIK